MKIALFSDIHANLPAFEAFLNSLDSQKPDAVYCLGDQIGYHIWPNEIVSGIRKRGIAALAGNHDLKTKGYAYELVSADNRNYLSALPAHIRLEFQLKGEKMNLVLVHGTPRSNVEYLLEDMEESYALQLMQEANADILCAGHSHKPYHRVIDRGNGKFGHVINIGSVGKPKDGDRRGCYVLLSINEHSTLTNKESIGVEFIRFEYDVEAAAKAIEASPLPDELADRLRKAY